THVSGADLQWVGPHSLGSPDTADYLVVVSAGWLIESGALDRLLAECAAYRPALVYTDDDNITEQGLHQGPRFKPDFSPELLAETDYIQGLFAIRLSAFDSVDWSRWLGDSLYRRAVILRASHSPSAQLHHLPLVLAHRFEPDRVMDIPAAVTDGQWLPTVPHRPAPLVSIIIPTRDQVDLLRTCVTSIRERTTYHPVEILIVDNGSTDPETLVYLEHLSTSGAARVVPFDLPFNFSAINNLAVDHADGEVVCLLNNDTEVIAADWIEAMLKFALRPGVGAVGAKLYYPDGRIQHAGVVLGIGGVAGHSHKYFPRQAAGHMGRLSYAQNASAVTGACLMVRKAVYQQVGGLDSDNLAVAFNDVDFCLRVREAGYRNVWTPRAELYHHESPSRGHEDTPDKQARFQCEVEYMLKRWDRSQLVDPYYNLNLTLEREDFSRADPPRWLQPHS
ncbi:MAG: glycosyltransferase, partial [Chromatiales bacterium]|nr:glycosyltransferase [Chromatiales bacterium]